MNEAAVIAKRVNEMKQHLSELYADAELLAPYIDPTDLEDLLRGIHALEIALKQGMAT